MTDFKDNANVILDKIDPIDFMSGYIDLEQAKQDEFKAVCPFHDDKNPSFFVNADNGLWHCFGCGESGNLINFTMRINNESYSKSMKRMGEFVGIKYEVDDLTEHEKMLKERQEILQKTQDFLNYTLRKPTSQDALKSIMDRGFTKEEALRLGLGYADKQKYDRFFEVNKFDLQKQQASKLKNMIDNRIVDTIPGRLSFPIRNVQGDLIGFSGGRIDKETQPKYKHSVFLDNGSGYYYNDLKANDENIPITIVEGFFDQISLELSGIKNVVSSLGTSVNEAKVKELLSVHRKFVIMMDGDKPGIKSAKKLARMFKSLDQFGDVEISLILVPDDLDPDDYRKKFGREKLRELFQNRLSELDFLEKTLETDGLSQEQILRKSVLLGAYADDDIQREMYFKRLSDKFSIDLDAIKQVYRNKESKLKTRIENQRKKTEKALERKEQEQTSQTGSIIQDDRIEAIDSGERISGSVENLLSNVLSTGDEKQPNQLDEIISMQEQTVISYLIMHPEEVNLFEDEGNRSIFKHGYAIEVYSKLLGSIKANALENFQNSIKDMRADSQIFIHDCLALIRSSKDNSVLDVTRTEFIDLVKRMKETGDGQYEKSKLMNDINDSSNSVDDLDRLLEQLREVQ